MEWLVDQTTYRHTKCMVCCFGSRRNANTRRGRGEMMDWVTFISKCPRTICLFYRQTQNIQMLMVSPFAEKKYIFVAVTPVDNQNADSKVKYFPWTSFRFSHIYCWCWFDSWNTEWKRVELIVGQKVTYSVSEEHKILSTIMIWMVHSPSIQNRIPARQSRCFFSHWLLRILISFRIHGLVARSDISSFVERQFSGSRFAMPWIRNSQRRENMKKYCSFRCFVHASAMLRLCADISINGHDNKLRCTEWKWNPLDYDNDYECDEHIILQS